MVDETRDNIYQHFHPMTKAVAQAAVTTPTPATVAEIEQEANWQGNSVQNKINALSTNPVLFILLVAYQEA